MTPEQQQFIHEWLHQVATGHVVSFLIGLLLMNLPGIASWFIQWRSGRREGRLWKARCEDKDGEISRLAAHNKRLENKLLDTQR